MSPAAVDIRLICVSLPLYSLFMAFLMWFTLFSQQIKLQPSLRRIHAFFSLRCNVPDNDHVTGWVRARNLPLYNMSSARSQFTGHCPCAERECPCGRLGHSFITVSCRKIPPPVWKGSFYFSYFCICFLIFSSLSSSLYSSIIL